MGKLVHQQIVVRRLGGKTDVIPEGHAEGAHPPHDPVRLRAIVHAHGGQIRAEARLECAEARQGSARRGQQRLGLGLSLVRLALEAVLREFVATGTGRRRPGGRTVGACLQRGDFLGGLHEVRFSQGPRRRTRILQ